jgi:hypothetical protein
VSRQDTCAAQSLVTLRQHQWNGSACYIPGLVQKPARCWRAGWGSAGGCLLVIDAGLLRPITFDVWPSVPGRRIPPDIIKRRASTSAYVAGSARHASQAS